MSPKTIKLYEQHVRAKRPVLRLIRKEEPMQAQNMPSTPATIALVDFSNLLVRNYKAMANDAGPNDAGQVTLNQLAEIRQMCETVVVCMDSPPYLRKQIYPEYKGKRERDEQLEVVRAWTVERLKKDGYQIARSPGHEADDVIAMLATEYPNYGCHDVRVFGNDKDACQLVSDVVRIFVPKGRGEYEIRDAAWVKQKYGVEPRDMALFQAICGDKSDGIPGIAGIGDKGAAKLITQFKDPVGMATACTRAVEESQKEGAKPLAAFWRNYAAGMASLPKWIQLTTLNTRCETERYPLEYLERLEPQPLVEEDELSDDLGDDPTDEVDWEFIAEATAAKEREELAKALPVGRPACDHKFVDSNTCGKCGVHVNALRAADAAEREARHDPSKMVIGKDPKADEALRELAAKTAPAVSSGSPSSTPSNGSVHVAQGQTISLGSPPAHSGAGISASPQPAATPPAAAPSTSSRPSETADPKAAHSTSAEASPGPAASPATASSSHVVPPTQGPQKRGDIIRSPEVTDIAIVQPPSWALATQPRTAKEMLDIAAVLYNSRFYSQFGNYRGVYSVMSLGRELGMGYAESLEAFHIVKEKPYPKAKWILSRCQKHPDFEWFIVAESTAERAVIKAKHKRLSEVLVFEYTIQEAEQQGHTTGPNRDNWKKSPRSMLRARAITGAAGEWCPGAAYAMPSAEEAEDYDDARR